MQEERSHCTTNNIDLFAKNLKLKLGFRAVGLVVGILFKNQTIAPPGAYVRVSYYRTEETRDPKFYFNR